MCLQTGDTYSWSIFILCSGFGVPRPPKKVLESCTKPINFAELGANIRSIDIHLALPSKFGHLGISK